MLPQDFAELLIERSEAQVEFFLIGGWAVVLYGHVRSTDAIDIVVRRNISREKVTHTGLVSRHSKSKSQAAQRDHLR